MSAGATTGTPTLRAVLLELVDAMPVGVVVLDARGKVVVYNGHEERLAGRPRANVVGKDFFGEIAPCLDVRELGGAFREGVVAGTLDARVETSFAHPHRGELREVVVRLRSFTAESEPYAAVFIEDVSGARQVERMKETLAQLLVHDLKNPLAAALANIGFVRHEVESSAGVDVLDALDEASTATVRAQRMIMTLLDFTRLQTGNFPLRRGHGDLATILQCVQREMQRDAATVGVELVVDASSIPLDVDASAVHRMVENLVDNALRHAPSGSRVTLRAFVERGRAVVEVADLGRGVPETMRRSIFDRFAQIGAQGSSHHGLGLAFVKMAARAHGGDALVLPNQPTGSIFRVTLPVTKDAEGNLKEA